MKRNNFLSKIRIFATSGAVVPLLFLQKNSQITIPPPNLMNKVSIYMFSGLRNSAMQLKYQWILW